MNRVILHPEVERGPALHREVAKRLQLELEKQRLEQSIDELEATLEALRSRPEAVESLARRELGWVRPGETVVILATPTPAPLPISPAEPEPTPILSLPD